LLLRHFQGNCRARTIDEN